MESGFLTNLVSRLELAASAHKDEKQAKNIDKPLDPILGAQERRETTALIKTLTSTYKQQDYTAAYLTVQAICPDLIEHMVLDHPAMNMKENRNCEGHLSKIHHLSCGHFVYTNIATVCARNCRGPVVPDNHLEMEKGNHFYCVLCVRDELCRARGQSPIRWHDLLLPIFRCQSAEAEHWKAQNGTSRYTEPAYIDANNSIMLPRAPEVIALIRTVEERLENSAMKLIEHVCAYKGHGEVATQSTLDNYEALLQTHQKLRYIDYATLAAIAYYYAMNLDQMPTPSFEQVAQIMFVAPIETSHRDTTFAKNAAQGLLENFTADQKIEEFFKKVPAKYRQISRYNKKQINTVTRDIRAKALKQARFSATQRRECSMYIIAACIQQAFKQHRINISMKEVCDIMLLSYDGWEGGDLSSSNDTRSRVMIDQSRRVYQQQTAEAGFSSRADIAETKIRRFVGTRNSSMNFGKKGRGRGDKKQELD
ncbi:hypothetical protein ACN47E_004834 [Coniothyrium glycines]